MKYHYPVVPGIFLSRPNRFIAMCIVDGEEVRCHVKNTSRCRELLIPGVQVWLTSHKEDPHPRSTAYSLIAVQKGEALLNMDSQLPNAVALEYLADGRLLGFTPQLIRREYPYGDSRIDLYAEEDGERYLIEVKGVTLEENGHARFPDAPTLRGLKHVHELTAAAKLGIHAILLFVLQFEGGKSLSPNDETHPAFGDALREAKAAGVSLRGVDCFVTPEEVTVKGEVPVCLNP